MVLLMRLLATENLRSIESGIALVACRSFSAPNQACRLPLENHCERNFLAAMELWTDPKPRKLHHWSTEFASPCLETVRKCIRWSKAMLSLRKVYFAV
jgi:hypothetical protein